MTIKLSNVIKFYAAKPHQDKAIAFLQANIDAAVMAKFAELWRAEPKLETKQLITMQQATAIFLRSPSAKQLLDLNACLVRFEITTHKRMRQFLPQIGHESGGLQWMQEIATGDAYEWRRDLGNVKPGDGRKYKGAGAIQLTGRANYQAFADHMNDQRIMQGSEFVAAEYPFTSAGFWWMMNGINSLVDAGANVEQISRMVNLGGANGTIRGLGDRLAYYARASKVFG